MREILRWRRADANSLRKMLPFRDEKFPPGDVGQVFNLPVISVDTNKAADHIRGSCTGEVAPQTMSRNALASGSRLNRRSEPDAKASGKWKVA